MTDLSSRLRRHSHDTSALRAWETACREANQAYARWSAEPSDAHYGEYLAAEGRAASAGKSVRKRQASRGGRSKRPASAR